MKKRIIVLSVMLLLVMSLSFSEGYVRMGYDPPWNALEIYAGEQFEKTRSIYGYETFIGYSFNESKFDIGLDIAHLKFVLKSTETIDFTLGMGVPVVFGVIGGDLFITLRPYAEIACDFFTNKDFGLVISARPGYAINFEGVYSGFSVPISIGLRADAGFIQAILAGL